MSELTNEQAAIICHKIRCAGTGHTEHLYDRETVEEALRMAEAALRGMGGPVAEKAEEFGRGQVFWLVPSGSVPNGTPLYTPRRGEE